jgi:2-oxoglutarate dehydrogenase complex dehydrogenase (E1) component-like enzyme
MRQTWRASYNFAAINICRFAIPTISGTVFHLLRRQVEQEMCVALVVMTPKTPVRLRLRFNCQDLAMVVFSR